MCPCDWSSDVCSSDLRGGGCGCFSGVNDIIVLGVDNWLVCLVRILSVGMGWIRGFYYVWLICQPPIRINILILAEVYIWFMYFFLFCNTLRYIRQVKLDIPVTEKDYKASYLLELVFAQVLSSDENSSILSSESLFTIWTFSSEIKDKWDISSELIEAT